MCTEKLNDILAELKKPFHPTDVYWKPGSLNKDQTKALALAYATLRAYQNRLDEVCGLEWAVTYSAWGDKIICHLTIAGVTRSSTGESDSREEKNEIAGTAAEAQAFKRACSMFALGRYLYALPTLWVEYDAQSRQFSEQAKARLTGIVLQHYQRALDSQAEAEESTPTGSDPAAEPIPAEAATADQRSDRPEPTGQVAKLRTQLHQLGRELYGENWDQVRHHNVERITEGRSTSANDLTVEQLQKLIAGLRQLKRQRRTEKEGAA
jgi:hypothetical protein